MQVTVGSLKQYLDSYDDEALVKFCTGYSLMGGSIVYDYGYIVVSTESVYGKEIVIHPYFPPFSGEGDDVDDDYLRKD